MPPVEGRCHGSGYKPSLVAKISLPTPRCRASAAGPLLLGVGRPLLPPLLRPLPSLLFLLLHLLLHLPLLLPILLHSASPAQPHSARDAETHAHRSQ